MNLVDRLTVFLPHRRGETEPSLPTAGNCTECQTALGGAPLYERYRVCPSCDHHFAVSARERIEQIVDPGTFRESARSLVSSDPLAFSDRVPYRRRIAEAQKKTGLADAVVTGIGQIGGRSAVLAVLDFAFLGGSMGSVVGEKVALAFELAVKKKLPAITVATSGGARMQEGMLSLVQMAKTAAAAQRLCAAGLPYISVLTNPTTGGVYASFANLGDVIIAEPHALIGFAGPRVAESFLGRKLPPGSHTAEFLLEHGQIDLIVRRPDLRHQLTLLLDLLCSRRRLVVDPHTAAPPRVDGAGRVRSAWGNVELARDPKRPTTLDYIRQLSTVFIELEGDRVFGDDPSVVAGVGDIGGQPVAIIGQERSRNEGRPRPEGYRKAQRIMELAAKFELPLVTLIDTPGAYPGIESEERGLASAIAWCLARLSSLPTPVIAVVIGEGGSGGALAFGVADRILMLEHAIYSVIGPEGAAAIIYRDPGRAQEVASALKLTAQDCKQLGVVDVVVPEPDGGAQADPVQAAWHVRQAIIRELAQLLTRPKSKLLRQRYQKFRRMGEFGLAYQQAVARELSQLQEYVQRGWEGLRDVWPLHEPEVPPEAEPEPDTKSF